MQTPRSVWSYYLHGLFSSSRLLMLAAALMLLTMLGGHELWTQEHRWADIVNGMFQRHDFFHPYLDSNYYDDKPLLSYWLIALVSVITHQLNTWVLRLPSALAGLLAIGSLYRLGARLRDQQFGLLCGWALLTTFFFIFWARVASADMLNLAGSIAAVAWYFEKREVATAKDFVIFFIILALTSLCKGLVGAVVPLIAIFPDLLYHQRFKKYLRLSTFLAVIPAAILYAIPFYLAAHTGDATYQSSSIYLVYKENIVRYFHPFDHKDPIYLYCLYIPIYLLPWTLFFIPALFTLPRRFPSMLWTSKWMVWALTCLFIFFTLSGSRRSYYVLPMIPFAMLVTCDWVYAWVATPARLQWMGRFIVLFFLALFLTFDVAEPLFYSQGGNRVFARELKEQANNRKPWRAWHLVLLDPESRVSFYLQLSPQIKNLGVNGDRDQQTQASLLKAWPQLKHKAPGTIYISRKLYLPLLQPLFPHYDLIAAPPTFGEKLFSFEDEDAPIAFVPQR